MPRGAGVRLKDLPPEMRAAARARKREAAEAVRARAATAPVLGTMNKTEGRRADYLELRKRAGEIHDYRYEAVKLRLAENAFLTLDFLVIHPDGAVELEDVKGRKGDSYYATEDARLKLKMAARLYPWFRITVVWESRRGEWQTQVITPCP